MRFKPMERGRGSGRKEGGRAEVSTHYVAMRAHVRAPGGGVS